MLHIILLLDFLLEKEAKHIHRVGASGRMDSRMERDSGVNKENKWVMGIRKQLVPPPSKKSIDNLKSPCL